MDNHSPTQAVDKEQNESTWNLFKNGEKKAFEALYQEHFKALCSYGMRLVGNKQILEDAIHDIFIDLWRRKEYLADVTDAKFYLLKALRNRLYNTGKKNVLDKSENIDDYLDYLISISSEQESIESESHFHQAQRINSAISGLSPRQKEVINLRFFHGLSLDEIAELMGLSKQSVSNLLFKSYTVLRISLKILSSLPFLLACAWGYTN
jgi:RNA polymerase sigma factor (sigma-70 family)